MSNSSLISARANEDANGGNVSIDAKEGFVITSRFSNSDIIASADRGNGGNVTITAQGVFGLKLRDAQTIFSDVVVSSRFGLNGNFTLTTGGDPTSSLNQVPREPRATEVADSCQVSNGKESVRFFDIGRGGLPPRPEDPLSVDLLEWTLLPEAHVAPKRPSSDKFSQSAVFIPQPSTALRLVPPCQSR
jgi:large exoprotein involved in heme utilization and adhesion